MKKVTWGKLTILNVLGVSLGEADAVIALHTQAGGKEIRRIYEAKDGVLIQLRDTDDDAEVAHKLLFDRFGKDRVIEVCPIKVGCAT